MVIMKRKKRTLRPPQSYDMYVVCSVRHITTTIVVVLRNNWLQFFIFHAL